LGRKKKKLPYWEEARRRKKIFGKNIPDQSSPI